MNKTVSVLVVDDEESNLTLVTKILSRSHPALEINTCGDLQSALTALRSKTYRLVITDFQIPVGDEGAEISKEAKRLNSACSVIVISGSLNDPGARIREKCTANEYLAKPFNPIDLIKIVGHLTQPIS